MPWIVWLAAKTGLKGRALSVSALQKVIDSTVGGYLDLVARVRRVDAGQLWSRTRYDYEPV